MTNVISTSVLYGRSEDHFPSAEAGTLFCRGSAELSCGSSWSVSEACGRCSGHIWQEVSGKKHRLPVALSGGPALRLGVGQTCTSSRGKGGGHTAERALSRRCLQLLGCWRARSRRVLRPKLERSYSSSVLPGSFPLPRAPTGPAPKAPPTQALCPPVAPPASPPGPWM